MNKVLMSVKDFLDGIPQFLSDLEPGNEYLKVDGVSGMNWKMLDKYSVSENETGDGFTVSGRLAMPLYDVISIPGWHIYKSQHPNVMDRDLYEMYLRDTPNMSSDFSLEAFCENFVDHYCDFLNDAGIDEDDLVLDGNSVRIKSLMSSDAVKDAEKGDVSKSETSDED